MSQGLAHGQRGRTWRLSTLHLHDARRSTRPNKKLMLLVLQQLSAADARNKHGQTTDPGTYLASPAHTTITHTSCSSAHIYRGDVADSCTRGDCTRARRSGSAGWLSQHHAGPLSFTPHHTQLSIPAGRTHPSARRSDVEAHLGNDWEPDAHPRLDL